MRSSTWAIYDLPNNEFNRMIVYWLSQYLVGNLKRTVRFDLSELNIFEQFYVYETWFSLIKCPVEMPKSFQSDNSIPYWSEELFCKM